MIESMAPIYDDIRQAIVTSSKSRYRIWQETGVSQSQLSQFMAGDKGFSVEVLEKLAACLGLEFTVRPSKRRKSGKKGS